ncbi:MAG: hypothetical protein ACXVLQ_02400 [Bacteriovorax sp.]
MAKKLLEITLLFLVGCNYSIPKNLATNSGNQAIEKLPMGTVPGYQLVNSGIIGPKCLECHSSAGGNAGGVNLETYANVSGNLASIRDEVTSSRMPKNRAPLSAREKEILLTWIDAGGPKDVANPTPAPSRPPTPPPTPGDVVLDPDKIDYQLVNAKVIGPKCLGCHSAKGNDMAGINLETYENVSDLIDVIKDEVSSGSMPMGKPLTEFQKKLFLTWIEKGAPKNVPQKLKEDL